MRPGQLKLLQMNLLELKPVELKHLELKLLELQPLELKQMELKLLELSIQSWPPRQRREEPSPTHCVQPDLPHY